MGDSERLTELLERLTNSDLPGLAVAEYTPDDGDKPTEVHLLSFIPALSGIHVVKLLSADAVDSLINALIKHREAVFGEFPKL